MAPNVTSQQEDLLVPTTTCANKNVDELDKMQDVGWKSDIKWTTSISIVVLHLGLLWCFVFYRSDVKFYTYIWGYFIGVSSGFGVTAGAHRLWTHRSYKAKLPLRIILAICFSMSGQNTMYDWVRDHRVHHKFTETDADPHNAKKGFFFAHVGWLMIKKHPEVIRRGRMIDMSDILADPVISFQTKYFVLTKLLFCFILPTIVPPLMWGERWYYSIMGMCFLRYALVLNFTWLVNSAAHIWGTRPFDKRMNPTENRTVAGLAMGEGWHNYHHVFPWDYKAAELGNYSFNVTTFCLDLFAKIGWAYDLKCPSKELVKRVAERYGDGSHPEFGGHMQEIREEEDTNMEVFHSLKQSTSSKPPLGSVGNCNGSSARMRSVISNGIVSNKDSLGSKMEVSECIAESNGELEYVDKRSK